MIRAQRKICPRCRRAGETCYCASARSFKSDALFVILIHPREARKRIGTARIVQLCIEDALLIEGRGPSFDENPRLRGLLGDPTLDPCLLFPGPEARLVEARPRVEGTRPTILVVDGTWHQAKKMVQESRVLSALPRVALAPLRNSAYEFRRQPAPHCLSTVEAVHEAIACLGGTRAGPHDVLLEVFSRLVHTQVHHGP